MNYLHKILQNPKIPKRLLIANVGLALLLIIGTVFNSAFLIVCTVPSFLLSGATLLYLILVRWQRIIPPKDRDGNIVEIRLPLSIGGTILWSVLSVLFWASFPSLAIALSNMYDKTEFIYSTEILYHIVFGLVTISAIVLTLIVLLIRRAMVIYDLYRFRSEWLRLLAESVEVMVTIVIYFIVYVISFMTYR